MKRILAIVLGGLVLAVGAHAVELQVGMPAADWSFPDADGNLFSMDSWKGRVLFINYVDPDESDLNEHLTDAMKAAKNDGRLKEETYKGIGIADCAATWKPDFLIRAIAGRKAEKYNTVILFDYDAQLRKAWGLQKDTSNIILLDKNRSVAAIVRGKVPQDRVERLVQLAVDLQSK
jgi:predicted transcriptional regulator